MNLSNLLFLCGSEFAKSFADDHDTAGFGSELRYGESPLFCIPLTHDLMNPIRLSLSSLIFQQQVRQSPELCLLSQRSLHVSESPLRGLSSQHSHVKDKPALYKARSAANSSLHFLKSMVPPEGFEPSTSRASTERSTN